MKKKQKSKQAHGSRRPRGPSGLEYILIVLAVVGALSAFGWSIESFFKPNPTQTAAVAPIPPPSTTTPPKQIG